jgi:hypothetical protein
MSFSAAFVKLRSLGVWSFLLATAPLTLGGCTIVEDRDYRDRDDDDAWVEPTPPPPANTDPMLVGIDKGAAVTSEPGEGVGIFVEYAGDGAWKIWTTCDTNTSKVVCSFDLYASIDQSSELIEIAGEDLERADQTSLMSEGVALLHAETGSDVDAMTLTTTPGAILRLEAYLDDQPQPRFVYWFGNGVLHEGAPTNPVDFEPSAP